MYNKGANKWACSASQVFWQRKHTDVLYIWISKSLIISDHLVNSVIEHKYNLLFSLVQGATVRRCAPEHT